MRSFFFIASTFAFVSAAIGVLVLIFCFDESSWTFQSWQCADNVELFDKYVCFGADLMDPLVPSSTHDEADGLVQVAAGAFSPLSSFIHFDLQLQRNTQHEYVSHAVAVAATAHLNVTWHDTYPAVAYPETVGDVHTYTGRSTIHERTFPLAISCPAWNALCHGVTVFHAHAPVMPFLTLGLRLADINIDALSGYKFFSDAIVRVSVTGPGAAIARLALAAGAVAVATALAAYIALRGERAGLLHRERRAFSLFLGASALFATHALCVFVPTVIAGHAIAGSAVVIATATCVGFWVTCEYTIATLSAFRERIKSSAARALSTPTDGPARALGASRVALHAEKLSSKALLLDTDWKRLVLPHVAVGLGCLAPAFAVRPLLDGGVGITAGMLALASAVAAGRVLDRGRERLSVGEELLRAAEAADGDDGDLPLTVALTAAPSNRNAMSAHRQLGPDDEAPVAIRPAGLSRTPSMLALLDRTAYVETIDHTECDTDSCSGGNSAHALPLQLASALTARLPYALLWLAASAVVLIVAIVAVGADVKLDAPVHFFALSFMMLFVPFTAFSVICDEALRVRGAVKAGAWGADCVLGDSSDYSSFGC